MFHVQDNLYVERLKDGSVRIFKTDNSKGPKVNKIFEQIIDSNSWCSIIATVSLGGESDLRWYSAIDFHNSIGQIKIINVLNGKEGEWNND